MLALHATRADRGGAMRVSSESCCVMSERRRRSRRPALNEAGESGVQEATMGSGGQAPFASPGLIPNSRVAAPADDGLWGCRATVSKLPEEGHQVASEDATRLARTGGRLIDVLRTFDEDKIRCWRHRRRRGRCPAAAADSGAATTAPAVLECGGVKFTGRRDLAIVVNRESNLDVNCDPQQHGKVPTHKRAAILSRRPVQQVKLGAATSPCGSDRHCGPPVRSCRRPRQPADGPLMVLIFQKILPLALLLLTGAHLSAFASTFMQSDPRPTIYSGQVSFGLLLSAHTSPGTELATAASDQAERATSADSDQLALATLGPVQTSTRRLPDGRLALVSNQSFEIDLRPMASEPAADEDEERGAEQETAGTRPRPHQHERRQIFERPSAYQVRRQQQRQEHEQQQHRQQQQQQQLASAKQQALDSTCGQVNPNALYAGMGAIWTSHQANLVGDSQLAIGTYVYDSCNDLDVGQRQSVRIVSNLNAFQRTTCESPRGSPISLTIAHGDNQLRAIQLLTSFKVPVISTKEHFALEDYQLLTREQRRFLFSTAPSSRHLAVGALKFSRRVVARSTASAKLPNQFHKMSSRNGLIVISRNLPARFIAYLVETIPNHVNYEMLQSNQPIDQVRSVEALEFILTSGARGGASSGGGGAPLAESRLIDEERHKRGAASDDSDSSADSEASDEPAAGANQRMLSPTILMFITPSEAIDLVTRLRNDLAEVSRYYSLIVSTREDISPALRTIFHRGGSRLCSGKAFYTISPKPDEVSEFSRYFRDTVQLEGESSDHPLVCEYAKHATTSRTNAELDDVGTESVIKAVWSAAAAFKLVHKRECGQPASVDQPDQPATSRANKQGRQSGGSGAANKSECLVKMNKNMAILVQRALKKLDVNINSTGLQALDGFRIKFDETNELQTNKYSIKYINKECEITEIGQYSGLKESQLHLDDDTLAKSLESTLPDPWPVAAPTAAPKLSSVSSVATLEQRATSGGGAGGSEAASSAANSPTDEASSSDSSTVPSDDSSKSSRGQADEDPEADRLPSITLDSESPKKKRSNLKPAQPSKQQFAMSSGRAGGLMPVLGDFYAPTTSGTTTTSFTTSRPLTNGPSLHGQEALIEADTPTPTMRKIKPFPNNGAGATLKEWLPRDDGATTMASTDTITTRVPRTTTTSTTLPTSATPTTTPKASDRVSSSPQEAAAAAADLRAASSTTQAPIYSTLPESGGNTDLEMPAFRSSPSSSSSSSVAATQGPALAGNTSAAMTTRLQLETAATSEASDYATMSSTRALAQDEPVRVVALAPNASSLRQRSISGGQVAQLNDQQAPKLNYLRDLSSAPIPLPARSPLLQMNGDTLNVSMSGSGSSVSSSEQQRSSRSRFKSQLRWIYGSWLIMTILGANICGALMTLYVLTFLLMKNCEGSLDRENQGIRSMHLLAIIVVFFGSTLFIVYPTPGLCLLRTSWHNFALVLIFGSLLVQAMQTRSISSIGLGGRPSRLNQFLTLVFMVGVQIAFELQRWKYESENYVNFVNQYFSSLENGDKKLMILASSMVGQFNPLNSFNDQVTPVSIQVSERYQNLLHEYCSQPIEEFLQSQIYLWIIISLLIVFSITARRSSRRGANLIKGTLKATNKSALTPTCELTTSGKLLASQHEANLLSGPPLDRPFGAFGSNVLANGKLARRQCAMGNVFPVTLISAPIYFISVVLHVHGQHLASHDLIASITMVLIAFTILVGTFLPVLRHANRYADAGLGSTDELIGGPGSSAGSMGSNPVGPKRSSQHQERRRAVGGSSSSSSSKPFARANDIANTSPSAFAMFPEFASTGLRRPSSIGGESGGPLASGVSRRPFAQSKESRRQMGVSLANLPGLSGDSLRILCAYNHREHNRLGCQSDGVQLDPGLLNLQLNLAEADQELANRAMEHKFYLEQQQQQQAVHNRQHHGRQHHKQQQQLHKAATSRHSSASGGEKRLIMLDVDPSCPRHGLASSTGWPQRQSAGTTSCSDNGLAGGPS